MILGFLSTAGAFPVFVGPPGRDGLALPAIVRVGSIRHCFPGGQEP